MFISLPFYYQNSIHLFPVCYLKISYQPIIYDNGMDFIYPLLFVNNNVNTRKSFILQLILFENLFKPRQLYLQPQTSVLSNLRLAA
ncbi:hypothetical protein PNI0008_01301 [Streptococcus pneumoniae PNI0008]|nr:hypothetical protein PNI0008_01301 [Streptococcus pneumoniae PNI0008]ELU74331.1 hypothetical protein PNI0007_00875 [Streptococcus pneumoniae PNI0007]